MDNNNVQIEKGSSEAPEQFYIKITPDGPYIVYGNPPMDQEIIIPNAEGVSWVYRKGKHFDTPKGPVYLCRCGASKNKPFCDGSHKTADWNPQDTAPHTPLLEAAVEYSGPTMILADNQNYCAYLRFCDACGRIWNIVKKASTEEDRKLACREVGHCAAGRLVLYDKESGKVFEPPFDPSLGIIEDPGIKASGPIWVKGGFKIVDQNGQSFEVRNRVTLCRCGQSSNKPFCDGTHASMHFHDDIPLEPTDQDW